MQCFATIAAIGTAQSICFGQSSVDKEYKAGSILFSESNIIDQEAIAKRDRKRAFFFFISNIVDHDPLRFTVDIGSEFHVWLDQRLPNPATGVASSARSLALALGSQSDENVKDKVFVQVVPWKSGNHRLSADDRGERFVSFDLNLATPYDTPKYWVMHFQAWQCCSGHPPLVMSVIPEESDADKITLQIAIRNDDSERSKYGQEIRIAKFPAVRDHWIHVAFGLRPGPVGGPQGKVKIWINGRVIVDWYGYWGFMPTQMSSVTHGVIRPDIGLDLGIYRRRQPSIQTVLISNIKYGAYINDIDIE